jgi:hypothetical protein
MTLDPEFSKVLESLEGIEKQLAGLNDRPTTAGISEQATPEVAKTRLLQRSELFELRNSLTQKSTGELMAMFAAQAAKKDAGIPFDYWANSGGMPVQAALSQNVDLQKALDSTGASALIRQDLEPLLYALFVKVFPAWDRFAKEPANGLVHAYNQVTAYGDAQFMTELGTVTDDQTTYVRKTTPVSVIATRRGISLRAGFAVQAGGMGYNPEQTELQGGLRAIAHKMQKTIFQGNATASGGTAADEYGAYDANAFDGLRQTLNLAAAQDADVSDVDPTKQDDIRTYIDKACLEIMNAGGSANIIYCRPNDKVTFDLQQDKNVRYMNQFVNVAPGVVTNAVNTVFGPLPLVTVPGDSIGTYDKNNKSTADMYILDESTISMPYLGTDGISVLEIPVGISGQLTRLYIMFGMWGLAVKALPFSNKLRLQLEA